MKKINNILIGALMAMGMVSCSQEAPFKEVTGNGTGRVLTSSLSVQIKSVIPVTRVNNDGIPEPADFKVEFFKKGETSPTITYERYGDMPEIVSLKEGEYYVKASYGGSYGASNVNAAFNSPHYEGISKDFKVEIDKITDSIGAIECKLANVRVAVNFDISLVNAMSSDSYVVVSVGQGGTSLKFDKNTEKDGYFAFAEGSTTLAANFIGKVEGVDVDETKTYDKVEKGTYYKITFKLHSTDASEPGNIIPGTEDDDDDFKIDASVAVKDLNDEGIINADPDDEQNSYVEDDMRPENGPDNNQGNQPGGNNPGTDPTDPDLPGEGGDQEGEDKPGTPGDDSKSVKFEVTEGVNDGPEGYNKVTFDGDETYLINGMASCMLHVTSDSEDGFIDFRIEINSNNTSFQKTMEEVFGGYIDLIEENAPGAWEVLGPLGLPIDIGGEKEVDLNLMNFFPFLFGGFEGEHEFNIIAKDSKGTSNIILNIDNSLN